MDRDGSNAQQLLACPEEACLNPAWSSDGQRLAFERRGIWSGAPNLDPGAGHLWLLDVSGGKPRPLFDYEVPAHSPVWQPGGNLLAYVSPLLPGIEIYDLDTGQLWQFANEWGTAPVWSPDGQQLVVPELLLAGEELVVHLIRFDLESEQLVDISTQDSVKDVGAAWSPAGGWIAFGRQFLDEDQWTPGRQLWLMRPDGSEAYALLRARASDLFAFGWRPDGAALVYLSTDVSEGPQPKPRVSVWVFDFLHKAAHLVAEEGVLAQWLP
jgi:Tol biopolymer transport system component